MKRTVFLALALTSAAWGAERASECKANNWNNRTQGHADLRESSIPPTGGAINVDAAENGGVKVKGWGENRILVRACVQTQAPTAQEAEALARQVVVDTAGAQIHASGPKQDRDRHWSVSYEVFVPTRSDLKLKTLNGGVQVEDVHGAIRFEAVNGGVHLTKVNGDVEGQTVNGGVNIELAGDRWDGRGMNIQTSNGGVHIAVPASFSAQVEASTVNGRIGSDFPMGSSDRQSRQVRFTIGSGGPLVRAVTTNGGVSIKRL